MDGYNNKKIDYQDFVADAEKQKEFGWRQQELVKTAICY